MQISKSDYMMFLRHPAWLWLKKHDKAKLPETDANTKAIFDAGHAFEPYAEALFPDGVKVGFDGYKEYLTLPERTDKAIADGAKTIFQGRFVFEQLTFICDVIVFAGGKVVDLYEIKSSSSASTSHQHDLAFQTIVLEGLGYEVRKIAVIHVNKEYVRHGAINPAVLTQITDVTEKVRKRIESTKQSINDALEVINQSEIPDTSPSLCGLSSTAEWIEIYKSLKGIKAGDGSIYDIYNPSATLIGKLESAGISKLDDVPEDLDGLSDKQKWQIKAYNQNKVLIDKPKIDEFMNKLDYPLYFLDYETMASIIPYFDGHRPNQNIPFQYSLHIIDKPGAELRHVEYLHTENSDPARPLSESLRSNIGDKGTVLVWWESFEKGCNSDMGEMLPDFREFYESVNDRIIDLIIPFYDFYYVDKRFGGSASIKDVLPVLAPQLSYKALGIQEGRGAQRLWMEAVLDGKREDQKEQILADLIEYCGLDTLAMVEIYRSLQQLLAKGVK